MKKPEDIKIITRTAEVRLVGMDTDLKIGDFTLALPDPGPTMEQLAHLAVRSANASLKRLMPQSYTIVVKSGDQEEKYGLTKWFKLLDSDQLAERERRRAEAAARRYK